MSKLIKSAKRGPDKVLDGNTFYTSANYASKTGGWPTTCHIRFQDENGECTYSAKFTVEEADKIARDFALYVSKEKRLAS